MNLHKAKHARKTFLVAICGVLLLSACATSDVADSNMPRTASVDEQGAAPPADEQQTAANEEQSAEEKFFSQELGLITAEQSEQFQQGAMSHPAHKAISVWPVFAQHQGKLKTIYNPNFIVANYQFQKPARLQYRAVMDYQINHSGIVQLADEADATLYLYTLFSVVKTAPGKTTLEYWVGASDWKYGQTLSDLSELNALLNTTIWCVVVREILDDAEVETGGKLDEEKLLKRVIAMSGAAMGKFLISQEQLDAEATNHM